VAHERRARGGAAAGHDVERARRQSASSAISAKSSAVSGVSDAGFEDDGAPGRERRRDFQLAM